MFMQEQLASSLHATFLTVPALCTAIIMDIEKLCSDLITSSQFNSSSPHWSVDSEGFLLLNNNIYIPDTSNLQLCILQYKHDHLISGHFRKNRTMELV